MLIGLLSLLFGVVYLLSLLIRLFGPLLRVYFLLLCGLFFNGWLLLGKFYFAFFWLLNSNRLFNLSRLLIWLFHSHFGANVFLGVYLRDHVIRLFNFLGNIIIE